MAPKNTSSSTWSVVWRVGAVALCLFLWPALVTFDAGDWPSPDVYPHHAPPHNVCGVFGAWLAYQLRSYLGEGAFPLLLFLTSGLILRLLRGGLSSRWERTFGAALVVACTSASFHLLFSAASAPLPVGRGGLLGYAIGEVLTRHLDRLGTVIVLGCALVVGLIFATQGWILTLAGRATRVSRTVLAAGARPALASAVAAIRRTNPPHGFSEEERAALLEGDGSSSATAVSARRRGGEEGAEDSELIDEEEAWEEEADGEEEVSVPRSRSARGKGRARGPIIRHLSPQDAPAPYPRQIENWRLPSIDLLHAPEHGFDAEQEVVVRKQAQVLEQTLEEFRIDAQVVEIDTGPVITMFELRLGAGIKVSQIASLSNDIARALKAHAIRVVAPISGKNTVGIEVPNQDKETVRLSELMGVGGRRASAMGLPLFLGKDAAGEALVSDLTRMPHLLIAGTTGSGKSVCLNAVVLSLLMTKRPDHVKMILIDPKMVEMSQFKDVPHLMCPIVTDVIQAQKILEWAVTQMDERYALFAESGVKNIAGYNRLGADSLFARLQPQSDRERVRITTHLPYIVIVIDELADLMMTSAKEVEHHLSRLAQKSRAVGVHIIVATQRPEAKVVTGLIKSNLPCRVCFRVASRMDSRIVLDQNGGEVLLGQGDMLFLPPGSHKLTRAQGTFLDDAEVCAVLDDLQSRAKPEFHPDLVRLRAHGGSGGARDPLFEDAVGVVLKSRRGSVSLLQRRLTIGYSRASRLIDQMADAGIVGEYKGSQAREVLLSAEQWQVLRQQVAEDIAKGYEADEDDPDAGSGDAWDDADAELVES